MLVHARSRDGEEVTVGVAGGIFTRPEAVEAGSATDLRPLHVLPGMVDAHAHLAATSIESLLQHSPPADLGLMVANGNRQLEAGVLAAVDKGYRDDSSLRYRSVDPDRRPHVEMAGGMIATPGGYYEGYGLEVAGSDLASAASAAATRAEWVKLVGDWPRPGAGPLPNFTEAELAGAVLAAHARGARVAIHTMARHAPSLAVAAGVDSIEHGLFLTEGDIEALGARGGAWVPTVAAVEELIGFLGADSGGGRLLREGLDNVSALIPSAVEAGVHILCGTDLAVPHGRLHLEAEALVAAGLTAEQAVDAACWSGQRYLHRTGEFAAGADADLVAFVDDPTRDVRALRDPVYIMRRGRVVLDRR